MQLHRTAFANFDPPPPLLIRYPGLGSPGGFCRSATNLVTIGPTAGLGDGLGYFYACGEPYHCSTYIVYSVHFPPSL